MMLPVMFPVRQENKLLVAVIFLENTEADRNAHNSVIRNSELSCAADGHLFYALLQ